MKRPAAGDRINNYILQECVGTGSFGQVWRARHHVFDQTVAIKVPTDAQYVRNLRQEGVAIHGIHHPNVVRALDLDPYADQPYLIMEYVDGPSLRKLIEDHPNGMPIDAVIAIMKGILSALEAAHASGLIHRDIKPENILIAGGNTLEGMVPERVKVTDFGLGQAGRVTTESILQSGSLVTEEGKSISGTIAYMSPEQRDGQTVDARSDLYACGIVLFELLTGDRPEGSESPSQVRHDVPAWFDRLFESLYARYDRRFASAAEALAAIEQGTDARRTVAPPRIVEYGPATRTRGPSGWRCTTCNGLVDATDHYCIHCGSRLVSVIPRCHVCGGYVHRDDRFCIFCGADLRPVSEQA